MSDLTRHLIGELHVPGDGTFTIFDASNGRYLKAREADRAAAVPEQVGDEAWQWTVRLNDDAEIQELDLDEAAWVALFTHPAQRGEQPSIHNSWCRQCTSVGVSRGVCC